MKKWTNEEVASLCASVAENGYSKGIKEFMNSKENVNGRTFAACEYMMNKQSKNMRHPVSELGDAVVSVNAAKKQADVKQKQEPQKDKKVEKEKKESFFTRFVRWFFCI